MSKHYANLKYLIYHKWQVFRVGLFFGVPIHQLIIHDWSKFLPSEWFPYANHFFATTNRVRSYVPKDDDEAFNKAWLLHQRRNPHHWQYWVLILDSPSIRFTTYPLGNDIWEITGPHRTYQVRNGRNAEELASYLNRQPLVLKMPERFAREMVADWVGAGLAQGYNDPWTWYANNSYKILLHPETRVLVEKLLEDYRYANY